MSSIGRMQISKCSETLKHTPQTIILFDKNISKTYYVFSYLLKLSIWKNDYLWDTIVIMGKFPALCDNSMMFSGTGAVQSFSLPYYILDCELFLYIESFISLWFKRIFSQTITKNLNWVKKNCCNESLQGIWLHENSTFFSISIWFLGSLSHIYPLQKAFLNRHIKHIQYSL